MLPESPEAKDEKEMALGEWITSSKLLVIADLLFSEYFTSLSSPHSTPTSSPTCHHPLQRPHPGMGERQGVSKHPLSPGLACTQVTCKKRRELRNSPPSLPSSLQAGSSTSHIRVHARPRTSAISGLLTPSAPRSSILARSGLFPTSGSRRKVGAGDLFSCPRCGWIVEPDFYYHHVCELLDSD